LFTKLWHCYFDRFLRISTKFGIFDQHLAIFVEQRQKRCHSFVKKKKLHRYELKLKHELLICKTISSPNMITIRHLNRRIFRPICNLFFRDDKLCHHFNPPVCVYWKKPQNRVNFPWKKNIQREEKQKKKGLFLFHNGLFLDQKIDEKRTMLPKFFHNDYDCPQINQMLETKNKNKKMNFFDWKSYLQHSRILGITLELKDEMKKKNYTHYNTKIFWMEKKNNTYEHYALKNNDGFFLYYYYYTYTMLSSKKKMKCNVPFQFLWKVVNSKL